MEPYLVIRISAAGTISSYIDTPRPALHFDFEAQLQRRVKMSHCRRAGRGLTDSESLICDRRMHIEHSFHFSCQYVANE